MSADAEQKIRNLLEPTADERRWYSELHQIDPAEAIPFLTTILHDDTETLLRRSRAVHILAELRDERGIPPLVTALDVSEPVLRARVARALGRFEQVDDTVVQRLIEALGDVDYFVRESSAKALADLKHTAALPALAAMSETDSVAANREIAQQAIESIQKAV